MLVAYAVVTLVTVAVNAAMAVADLAGASFVHANAAAVGLPRWAVPYVGVLKLAGAAGLLLGLAGTLVAGAPDAVAPPVRGLAIAAATGLVLFFAGALGTHVRARALRTMPVPGAYFALAVASLVLAVAV